MPHPPGLHTGSYVHYTHRRGEHERKLKNRVDRRHVEPNSRLHKDRDLLRTELAFAASQPHIWWGVSVENRKHGLPRVEHLRAANAAMSFLSIEPLLENLGKVDFTGIDWVIVGGESGAGARAMDRDWVVNILGQCRATRVPFFFKQWGGVRKRVTGRSLDGQTYDAMPERLCGPVASATTRKALIQKFAKLWPPTNNGLSKHTA